MTGTTGARDPVLAPDASGPSVLVVEDDPGIATQLVRGLSRDGYRVEHVLTGSEALARGEPDVVLLDLELPDSDGVHVCRRLRERSRAAIIVVTAHGEEADRVAALDAGADDYLVKPFANEELVARVHALLRRAGAGTERLAFADLELDLLTRDARRGGREIALSRLEFELLEFLLRHPRQVLARSLIYERVWGYDASLSSNSLDVFVGHLRRKLEASGERRLIQTVRGVGFTLREQ